MTDSPRVVMVTGAVGFIGTHLVQRILLNTNWNVVAIARGIEGNFNPRVQFVAADLSAECRLPEADVVFSLAASVDVARSLREPRSTMVNNAGIAATMVNYVRSLPVPPLLVHVTTAEVFGPNRMLDLYEPARPTNPYAASKAAQDAYYQAAAASYGIPIVSARTANVFGEHQGRKKFVPTVIRHLKAGEPVKLFGEAKRRWIHADDVADALIALAQNPTDANVTGAELVDNANIVERIADRLHVEPRIDVVPVERPGHEAVYDVAPVNMPIVDNLDAGLDKAVAWWS